ncbi:MAG: hypothetical protein AB7T27_07240 [Kiritimatiellia bacterium]
MQKKAAQIKPAKEQSAQPKGRMANFALLFELDNMAVNVRELSYGILKAILAKNDCKLPEIQFCRHGLCATPEVYLPKMMQVLEIKKPTADKLARELLKTLGEELAGGKVALNAALDAVLREASAQGIRLGAISALPEDMAHALAAKLGLTDRGVELFVFAEPGEVFPRADTWLKVAKAMAIPPRHCKVLATSMASCKAALSTGMNSVAVPDRYTSFHDFGGASMILDSLGDVPAKKLIADMFPLDEV